MNWQPIETAPTDGTAVLTFAPGAEFDLPDLWNVASYHEDAGWCVCELRYVTHWMPLPPAPAGARPPAATVSKGPKPPEYDSFDCLVIPSR